MELWSVQGNESTTLVTFNRSQLDIISPWTHINICIPFLFAFLLKVHMIIAS